MTGSHAGKSLVLLGPYKSIIITDCWVFFSSHTFPMLFYVDKDSPDKCARDMGGSGVVSSSCNAEQDLGIDNVTTSCIYDVLLA